jgi:hypothetical protein
VASLDIQEACDRTSLEAKMTAVEYVNQLDSGKAGTNTTLSEVILNGTTAGVFCHLCC